MRKIYKYQLGVEGTVVTLKGHFKKFLNVKYQPGVGPVIWAEVDDDYPEVERKIAAWGTGWPVSDQMRDWEYLGSEIDAAGYVWHYYGDPFFNFPENNKELMDIMDMLLASTGVEIVP